jgi:hypothetical protein
MMGRWSVTNPYNDNDIDGEPSKKVRALRKARGNARRATRSGNPAKRAEAQSALDQIPGLINGVYVQDLQQNMRI